jgi:MFS family permease
VSWRAIFLVNVPLGVVGLLNAARTMSQDHPTRDRRLDVIGFLTLSPGVTALVLGLSEAGRLGRVAEASVIVPVTLGIALVGGHLVRSVRMSYPLVRFALMRHRSLAVGSAILAFFVAAYFGSMLVLPLNLQLIRGESATTTGMFNIPQAIATGVSLQVASRLSDRIGARRIVLVGIALAATGFGGYAAVTAAETPYVQLIAWMVVAGVGVGATLMPTMTSAVRTFDGDDLASGNTVLQIVNQTMVSVGTAVMAVVFATLFAQRVDGVDDVDGAYRLTDSAREAAAPQMADALQLAMLLPVGLMLCALAVAMVGWGQPTGDRGSAHGRRLSRSKA